MTHTKLDTKSINTIRFLAADAIQTANSGHPGLPMGMASVAYSLFTRHMRFYPADPFWPNRDRFVLSAGHGSMLLYALLHLSGYDLPLEELKNFRQWGSRTPGHPEWGLTPGVEMTTGPLGQGFAAGVGMALAAERAAALYNKDGYPLFDHYIYAIVSDGDLMEGVASEAASLAGHFKLGRLIYMYDDNRISIDGSTEITFTEDRAARFEAYGWHVNHVADANNLDELDKAIEAARKDPRPSLIVVHSRIGFGLPTKENTAAAHGEPPGKQELAGAKEKLVWPQEPWFLVPEEVRSHFEQCVGRWAAGYEEWQEMLAAYKKDYPELGAQLARVLSGDLPDGWIDELPSFEPDPKGLATRASSGKVLNAIAPKLPELFGGSADLTGSNKTDIKGEGSFSVEERANRYIHYGVREHAMGAIMNGIALYRGFIPYGGTFLVFSDYMRGAMRLAALMKQRVIYVLTHDSIGLGEDGPTHQPIEHLAALRSIPNMVVLRPSDANEVSHAWKVALERKDGPTVLALSRQSIPTLDRGQYASADGVEKGAYILADPADAEPQVILMASGSEVDLIVKASELLEEKGIPARLISFPSWELFEAQSKNYQEKVLPRGIKARVAVEAGVTQGWHRWVGEDGVVIALDHFGESAPYQELYQHFGLTVEAVLKAVDSKVGRSF
jgi:transketolase